MHLVLGPQRIDLCDRVVVIARLPGPGGEPAGADLAWLPAGATGAPGDLPFGTDAGSADDVHRLADAGAVAVGLPAPTDASCDAAVERGLTVLVPEPHRSVAASVAADRLLVVGAVSRLGTTACLDLHGTGPAAWGRATVALSSGVRVVRTSEPRSIRRIAVVVERLQAAGAPR